MPCAAAAGEACMSDARPGSPAIFVNPLSRSPGRLILSRPTATGLNPITALFRRWSRSRSGSPSGDNRTVRRVHVTQTTPKTPPPPQQNRPLNWISAREIGQSVGAIALDLRVACPEPANSARSRGLYHPPQQALQRARLIWRELVDMQVTPDFEAGNDEADAGTAPNDPSNTRP